MSNYDPAIKAQAVQPVNETTDQQVNATGTALRDVEKSMEMLDPNVVWWEGDCDPLNPYNWPTWRKTLNCALVCGLTFLCPLASSIFAPGVPRLMKEFENNSPEVASFVVSIYVLGFAFGPLIMAPFSEMYGRTITYHFCNLGFICFIIGCALAPTLPSLVAFRFLSGFFGSAPITNYGGTVSDVISTPRFVNSPKYRLLNC